VKKKPTISAIAQLLDVDAVHLAAGGMPHSTRPTYTSHGTQATRYEDAYGAPRNTSSTTGPHEATQPRYGQTQGSSTGTSTRDGFHFSHVEGDFVRSDRR
jgi:hypothetical protein